MLFELVIVKAQAAEQGKPPLQSEKVGSEVNFPREEVKGAGAMSRGA